jgi:hypothetical protein
LLYPHRKNHKPKSQPTAFKLGKKSMPQPCLQQQLYSPLCVPQGAKTNSKANNKAPNTLFLLGGLDGCTKAHTQPASHTKIVPVLFLAPNKKEVGVGVGVGDSS